MTSGLTSRRTLTFLSLAISALMGVLALSSADYQDRGGATRGRSASKTGVAVIGALGADVRAVSALIRSTDGSLYGTTESGGEADLGTIFRIEPDGAYEVLHSFNGSDGAGPVGLVRASDGALYGTTGSGGSGYGTIFRLAPDGSVATLHSFSGADGAHPAAGLIQGADGNFYGTTRDGGSASAGTVFRLAADGTVTVLHSFGQSGDGMYPGAALLQASDGALYGTTAAGGTFTHGTVFRMNPDGDVTVLHSFRRTDGEQPTASLIQGSDGNLYGITDSGGQLGHGTTFRITPDRGFTVLHAFNSDDGANPSSALIQLADGTFYGTTARGGTADAGTVFRMTIDGAVSTVHDFTGADDGANPHSPLVQGEEGKLYGATRGGGANDSGVVFVLAVLGVTVTSPNGGENLYTGTPHTITWDATAGAASIDHFDVEVSINGGSTWSPVPGCTAVGASARNCVWSAPGPESTQAKIRVTATDNASGTASDTSDAVFKIKAGTGTVTLSAPNTAVHWGLGSMQKISWKHTLGTGAAFRIELSRDGGGSFGETIAPSVRASTASAGNFDWRVTGPATAMARVRVTAVNAPGVSDSSNANFIIEPAVITVTMPKSSANWGYGTIQKPTWTSNLGSSDKVDVLLSTDGGTTFPSALATNVAATAKQKVVTTPTLSTQTTAARIKVNWSNAPAGFAAAGVNTGNFKIFPPFVTVTSPNGGESWIDGTSQTVKWTSNLGKLENVNIDLSQDGGATYPIALASSTTSDGTQQFTVMNAWNSAHARLRIAWSANSAVKDASNNDFTISAPPFVTVTSPNGGEVWTDGTQQTISWNSNLPVSENVKIELSRDGGATYPIVLAASTPSDGSEAVTVQSGWNSTTARIRITSLSNSSVSDTSNANFTIAAPTGPFINVTSPNGGETWADGSTQTITWTTNLAATDTVKVELSQDGGATYPITILASTPNDGSQQVTVLAAWNSTTARIRITSLGTPSAVDASNANFTISAAATTVSIQDFSFAPGTLTVPVGTTVTWTNNGAFSHTTTSDTGVWTSGLMTPGASFSFTFTSPGTFAYHCEIHLGMTGTIIVQ